jgi:type VI secretion system ImpB/VipA family protein
VTAGIQPRLALRVKNELQKENTKIGMELRFRTLEDFEPAKVVRQVEPLRQLLGPSDAVTTHLFDLLGLGLEPLCNRQAFPDPSLQLILEAQDVPSSGASRGEAGSDRLGRYSWLKSREFDRGATEANFCPRV